MKLTDWRGNEYGAGDTVVYPASWGSHSTEMVEAEVIEVISEKRVKLLPTGRCSYFGRTKRPTYPKVKNITVLNR